jgi:hypothetical protein
MSYAPGRPLDDGRPQTGPKGVLADARHARAQEFRRHEQLRLEAQRAREAAAMAPGWMARQVAREDAARFGGLAAAAARDDDGPAEPGTLVPLSPEEWVGLVEDPVLAHVPICILITAGGGAQDGDGGTELEGRGRAHVLRLAHELAAARPDTIFVHSRNAELRRGAALDPLTLPALLAYRGGELAEAAFRLTADLPPWRQGRPERLTLAAFAAYLESAGVLPPGC